jgi:hypothetical protein
MQQVESAFLGRWKIVAMELWEQDFVDLEEPGHITFNKGGSGGFHFGCVDASLDWQYETSIDRVDFTFDGCDEGDQVNGRGWAKNEGKQMVGQIVFHMGDESGFKASRSKL